ncbi:hypothetical protein BLNAU_9809 [Blattamonas nauphoetae]|uniref:Uncharacterized protein n=1 Tax=Blattamonas nauphoetae TaxID=2049346 RepID=A0ABQ9XUW1_9EUKA|nr:hypothetical protein BLNAU_9809 [Blattamonas nauphoetae]
MDITTISSNPQIDATKVKIQNCVEVFFGQICGDSETLRTVMLNTLLVLATESDWALSTIVDVDYIEPVEEYCKKTQPSDVSISLPKFLIMIGKTSEGELDRICESSIPSFFFEWLASISSQNVIIELGKNTVLEVICEGFSLFSTLLLSKDDSLDDILIECDFVPLLKSTIIACLDLLEQLKIVESSFSDVPQLCSLLERTCCHSSPTQISHLGMIINVSAALPHLIPRMLEENLVQRVINTSNPIEIPTTHGDFHLDLVWALVNLIWNPKHITKDKQEWKKIRMLQFERVLKPAKHYLQFFLQREEFIPKAESTNWDLSTIVGLLFRNALALERDLFEFGEIVGTGREEWEVGWLVEKTNETDLKERLNWIREDDEIMKKDEKARWKKRVERQREAGHEDAMEGWLIRRDRRTRTEIVVYVRQRTKGVDLFESGARLLPRVVDTACPSSTCPVLIVWSVGSDDVKFAVLAECKTVPKLTTTVDFGAPSSCVVLDELLALLVFCNGNRDTVDVVNGRDPISDVRFVVCFGDVFCIVIDGELN